MAASCLPKTAQDICRIQPSVYKHHFQEYLELRMLNSIERLLLLHLRPDQHTSFNVLAPDIIDFDASLGFSLIHFPRLLIPVFEDALLEIQTTLHHKHPGFERKHGTKGTIKKFCHIRILNIPPVPHINKKTISDIRSTDFEQFLQICGTVVRTGTVRVLEVSKEYQCMKPRCGYRFSVLADPEQGNMLPTPRSCPGPKPGPPANDGSLQAKCQATNLEEVPGSRVCVDYQEIRIQDKMESLGLGHIPRTITVILEADLADKYNAGDDVAIVGTVVRRWAPVATGLRCHIELALRANSVKVLNSNEEYKLMHQSSISKFREIWKQYTAAGMSFTCRDNIIRAVCPQLRGLFFVKLALLLTILGGSNRSSNLEATTSTGVSRRTQSHLLIVGDPGTGKSQLLRFASSLLPRSVLTTGVGTTGAGLTCTAVRDGNDWVLEAGALVLANEGVCCIDEFVSIKEQDRACIHEAMEQQTISVAKAGLLVKLNTRATVIAVSNPKGSYDINSDLTTNTAIASPLLSRFDIVLVLIDMPEKNYDKRISTFLLQQAVGGGVQSVQKKNISGAEAMWSLDMLRLYVLYCRENLNPSMDDEARFILMRYYQMQRQSDSRSSARTTVRLLESLMRLAEAHAKLMFRDIVLLQDAVVAISCLELSASVSFITEGGSLALHAEFPEDPEEYYQQMEKDIFRKLHYSRERLDADFAERSAASADRATNEPMDNILPTQESVVETNRFTFPSKRQRVDESTLNATTNFQGSGVMLEQELGGKISVNVIRDVSDDVKNLQNFNFGFRDNNTDSKSEPSFVGTIERFSSSVNQSSRSQCDGIKNNRCWKGVCERELQNISTILTVAEERDQFNGTEAVCPSNALEEQVQSDFISNTVPCAITSGTRAPSSSDMIKNSVEAYATMSNSMHGNLYSCDVDIDLIKSKEDLDW